MTTDAPQPTSSAITKLAEHQTDPAAIAAFYSLPANRMAAGLALVAGGLPSAQAGEMARKFQQTPAELEARNPLVPRVGWKPKP